MQPKSVEGDGRGVCPDDISDFKERRTHDRAQDLKEFTAAAAIVAHHKENSTKIWTAIWSAFVRLRLDVGGGGCGNSAKKPEKTGKIRKDPESTGNCSRSED